MGRPLNYNKRRAYDLIVREYRRSSVHFTLPPAKKVMRIIPLEEVRERLYRDNAHKLRTED